MALASGVRLGVYEVRELIGAGGMGEVYRALDTKLNRDVALKILPDVFANDPDRLARFKREAQVLASLNHANIASIYGFEESDGVRALVLELVRGTDARGSNRAGSAADRRGDPDCAADRRCAGGRACARHRPSRSEAGQYQGPSGRHGKGAGLWIGEDVRPG